MKKIIILLFSMALVMSLNAQSIFKPLPKKQISLGGDSTMNAFRPVANIISYSIPDNRLLSGAGIGYEHLKWHPDIQKWKTEWSINALIWYSKSLSGEDDEINTILYGLSLGVLNNLIMVGICTDSKRVMGTIGLGISLNN